MSSFKGTKGKWIINHWEKGEIGIKCLKIGDINFYSGDAVNEKIYGIRAKIDPLKHNIQGSFEGAHIADIFDFSEESKANALLMSKAREILEMLEKLVNGNPMHDGYHELKLKAINLIKEATTI